MANKLPWMKHDHNARKDLFIRSLQDRFGHFGYAGWFKLLEVLHEHGTGDNLLITWSQLASELDTRPSVVRQLVAICRTSGKVEVKEVGQEVVITVKNFRKKQANKHRQENSLCDTNNGKPVLDGEEEGEGENNKLGFAALMNGITAKVGGWKYDVAALEAHQFPFGKDRGRRVIDFEASKCQWYLDRIQMDAKTTAALKHRIKLKQSEAIK